MDKQTKYFVEKDMVKFAIPYNPLINQLLKNHRGYFDSSTSYWLIHTANFDEEKLLRDFKYYYLPIVKVDLLTSLPEPKAASIKPKKLLYFIDDTKVWLSFDYNYSIIILLKAHKARFDPETSYWTLNKSSLDDVILDLFKQNITTEKVDTFIKLYPSKQKKKVVKHRFIVNENKEDLIEVLMNYHEECVSFFKSIVGSKWNGIKWTFPKLATHEILEFFSRFDNFKVESM